MATLFGMFPFLKTLFADSGYQGPKFAKALAKVLPHLDIEIVKRSDQVSGFVVLPKRWIVERTIAWLNRCRRLAKDWECLNRKALAFLRLASIHAGATGAFGRSDAGERGHWGPHRAATMIGNTSESTGVWRPKPYRVRDRDRLQWFVRKNLELNTKSPSLLNVLCEIALICARKTERA